MRRFFGAAIFAESIGVSVSSAFCNGVQRLFPQSLVPAIKHAWNSKGTQSSVCFGDINATHRFALVAFPDSLPINGSEFLVWSVPNNSVYSWGFISFVGGHNADCHSTCRPGIYKVMLKFRRLAILRHALSLCFHATLICTCILYGTLCFFIYKFPVNVKPTPYASSKLRLLHIFLRARIGCSRVSYPHAT